MTAPLFSHDIPFLDKITTGVFVQSEMSKSEEVANVQEQTAPYRNTESV